jgi:hypothetical protein
MTLGAWVQGRNKFEEVSKLLDPIPMPNTPRETDSAFAIGNKTIIIIKRGTSPREAANEMRTLRAALYRNPLKEPW